MNYYCECDYRGTPCNKIINPLFYEALSKQRRELGDGLYVVHEDHLAGEVEMEREGDCVLVRATTGDVDEEHD